MLKVDCRVYEGLVLITDCKVLDYRVHGGLELDLYWTVLYTEVGTCSVVDCEIYGGLVLGLY